MKIRIVVEVEVGGEEAGEIEREFRNVIESLNASEIEASGRLVGMKARIINVQRVTQTQS